MNAPGDDRSKSQPQLVQAEPGLWQRLTGIFERRSNAVIANRLPPEAAPAATPRVEPPPTPAPVPEAPRAAVPLSPPAPAPAPTASDAPMVAADIAEPAGGPPPETEHRLGDEVLIAAWRESLGQGQVVPGLYVRGSSNPIDQLEALADSPFGDWIYKTFLKPGRRR